MHIIAATDETFKNEVLEASTPVLVDFWAKWCGPCRMIAPVLEELAAEMTGKVKIVKVDIDENPEVPTTFGVRSIPTLILFKEGKVQAIQTGAAPKGVLVQWLESHL